MSLIIVVGLLFVLGAQLLLHGVARHFAARALGVKGTRLLFQIADPVAYRASPRGRRLMAAAAGPLVNYVVCALCFVAAALVAGTTEETTRIDQVIPDGPASRAGVYRGDRIVAVDGKPVATMGEVRGAIGKGGDTPKVVEIERQGGRMPLTITPQRGRIGVTPLAQRGEVQLGAASARSFRQPAEVLARVFFRPGTRVAEVGEIERVISSADDRREQVALMLSVISVNASLAWPLSLLVAGIGSWTKRSAPVA